MARDIKKMFDTYEPEQPKLEEGHQARFEAKLDRLNSEKLPKKNNNNFYLLKIAAMIVVLLAVSFFGYRQLSNSGAQVGNDTKKLVVETNGINVEENETPQLTLADLSPNLKKVEEYYLAGINLQLASLKITDYNKDLVEGSLRRLAELDKEYTALNAELSRLGPTEATVTALIDNLKLRLDLLFKLKNKLNELKKLKNEEIKPTQL